MRHFLWIISERFSSKKFCYFFLLKVDAIFSEISMAVSFEKVETQRC